LFAIRFGVGQGNTSFKHTLDFRFIETDLRNVSLGTQDQVPNQVHYWVYRKIEKISELDESEQSKPYQDVFSLYLVLRQASPHQVVARSLGKSVNVLKA